MHQKERITLASKSPRRSQLLRQIGLKFTVKAASINEKKFKGKDPSVIAMNISRMKAEAVSDSVESGLIIGADTIVVLNDQILGKPANENDARRMLSTLSGKTHQVYTGFTLIQVGGREISDFAKTEVTFRPLESWEIDSYIASGSPMDKAGAYGIQDASGVFVSRIQGCFYNVVGLPLNKFYNALNIVWGPDRVEQTFR